MPDGVYGWSNPCEVDVALSWLLRRSAFAMIVFVVMGAASVMLLPPQPAPARVSLQVEQVGMQDGCPVYRGRSTVKGSNDWVYWLSCGQPQM